MAAIKGMTTLINALICVVMPRGHSDGYKGVKITIVNTLDLGVVLPRRHFGGYKSMTTIVNSLVSTVMPRSHSYGYKRHDNTS